jgi:hypothetical protein
MGIDSSRLASRYACGEGVSHEGWRAGHSPLTRHRPSPVARRHSISSFSPTDTIPLIRIAPLRAHPRRGHVVATRVSIYSIYPCARAVRMHTSRGE